MKDGWHTVKIMAYGLSGESSRDKAQFAIGFESVETPGDGITFYGGFKSDAAQDFTEKVLNKCGWNGDYEKPELTEAPVRILVETETYNGKTRQKVKAVAKSGGGGFKPMEPGSLAAFAKSLKRPANGARTSTADADYDYGDQSYGD